ncbi:hypothetical protein [Nocardioides nanhaiensis]
MHRRVDEPSAGSLVRWALLLGALPASLALALGVVIAASVEETFGDLTRDLTVTTASPLYVGALSALTVMVWTAGAAVALATAWPARHEGPLARLLLMLGVLTLALALDDQFMVHDGTLQKAGIPGETALVGYVVWLGLTVALHRDLLRARPETSVLLLGAGLLGASLVVDLVVEIGGITAFDSLRILVEDGLKLLGAAVWGVGVGALARAVQREVLGVSRSTDRGIPTG